MRIAHGGRAVQFIFKTATMDDTIHFHAELFDLQREVMHSSLGP